MNCRMTVIASGKGGVGKTTLTANLSACLSKRGKKVLAVDADLNLRNLDLVSGVQDQCMWNSEDVFREKCTLEDALTEHERFPGFFVLPAPFGNCDEDALSAFLNGKLTEIQKTDRFDHILIDCPSGISENISAFFQKNTTLVITATPDITSIRDAQRVAEKAYQKGMTDVWLVVNRVRARSIEKGRAPDIDYIMDSVEIRLLGLIPEDKQTSEAAFAGSLVSELPRSRSKKAYENIAARLDGEYRELYEFWK